MKIAHREIGTHVPPLIVAELGANHLGWTVVAKRMIDVCAEAGVDYVKGQIRDIECLQGEHMDRPHPVPENAYGATYREHRSNLELLPSAHKELRDYAQDRGTEYVCSAWDIPSADVCAELDLAYTKIPSACVTDLDLLQHLADLRRPVVLSTGMSTLEQVREAVDALSPAPIVAVLAATSTYPTPPEEVNLRTIDTLREELGLPIGVSGHWEGIAVDSAAVAMGACMIERHVTLSQRLPGTDHAASLEPGQLRKLVRDVRRVEQCLGDGEKRVYPGEVPIAAKLRRTA